MKMTEEKKMENIFEEKKEIERTVEKKDAKEEKREKIKEEKKDKKKKTEEKPILEREYIIPLRRKFLKSPRYKRTPKAIKALKQFVARHMKIYDRDLRKVKIDRYLNEELWFRGIKNPLPKVKVKVKKFSDYVTVELVELPEKLKFKKAREEREGKEIEKKIKEKSKKIEDKSIQEEKTEGTEEKKEKMETLIESGKVQAEQMHKEIKHQAKQEKGPKHQHRKALKK